MNLSIERLRELLESFLQNTGGRRGRQREQVREQRQAGGAGSGQPVGQAPPGEVSGQAGQTAQAVQDVGGESGAVAVEATGGGMAATVTRERPDTDDLDDEEVVDDLYHRIESLEEELQRNDARMGSIRDAQEQVVDEVSDVNDTVRELVGIYDMLTRDVNPFVGDGEEESGFGLFTEGGPEEEGFGIEAEASTSGGETVSFDDLKAVVEETVEPSVGEPQKIPFADEIEAETSVEADDEGGSVPQPEREGETGETDDAEVESDEGDDVTLDRLAPTYASDVIVFEWLTEMVRTAGPSATLRAISYYHEIGWIEADVRSHLEAVLSGPDLDIYVDPDDPPEELTADDHADSYEFIMKLTEIHEAKGEVEVT